MDANLIVLAGFLIGTSALIAQQTAFTNSGGTISLGTDLVITGSSVASPAGAFSLSCPISGSPIGTCNGGTVTIQSTDGLTSVSGSITAGTLTETAVGGGRGNPTTYYYTFSGAFAGTMTVNGLARSLARAALPAARRT